MLEYKARNAKLLETIAFDAEKGVTVLEPVDFQPGNWIGAADVIFDANTQNFYLYARTRKPANPADPMQRGSFCAIYAGKDGVSFEPIWTAGSSLFDSVSVEKGSLLILPDGTHRLYISYESPGGRGWQIDMLEADSFQELDAAYRLSVLTPDIADSYQIKDPKALYIDGNILVFANYGVDDGGEAAGLAISNDGINFEWVGRVLPASSPGSWDCWSSRMTGVLKMEDYWLLFYDGAALRSECFEEQSGLAFGYSPENFRRLTVDGPLNPGVRSDEVAYINGRCKPAVGGMRYLTALAVEDTIYYYYEWTRPDGSHELRVSQSSR